VSRIGHGQVAVGWSLVPRLLHGAGADVRGLADAMADAERLLATACNQDLKEEAMLRRPEPPEGARVPLRLAYPVNDAGCPQVAKLLLRNGARNL
jgi:hypothetical protein